MEHAKVENYVILCLVLQKLNFNTSHCLDILSLYGSMVYSTLPLGLLKAVSSNSINNPQNLLLVQIYYGIGNQCQFAL